MKCPKCGTTMTIGASHDPGGAYQYECWTCGKVVVVPSGFPSNITNQTPIGEYNEGKSFGLAVDEG